MARDCWNKADIIGKLAGSILIPVALALGSYIFNEALQERADRQKTRELAITVLQSEKTDKTPQLRAWALGVLEEMTKSASQTLPPAVINEIKQVPLPTSQTAAVSRPPAPLQIRRFVAQRDYSSALKVCNELIAYWTDTGKQSPKDAFDANSSFFLGYYLLVRAQIFAIAGDFSGAEQSVGEAERSVTIRGGSEPGILDAPWLSSVRTTKGFVAEKKGNIEEASAAYRDANTEKAYGRLALLCVQVSRVVEAKTYAAKDPNSPTSLFALGEIAANNGNKAEALQYFTRACTRLEAILDGKEDANDFMPILVCEAEGVRAACAKP
jgi:tetratricopeptide (TPR) repeat protein